MGDERQVDFLEHRAKLRGGPAPIPPDPVDAWKRQYDDGSYPEDFWDWLRDNRHIFDAFIRAALEAKRGGRKQWSARSILHAMRWQSNLRELGQAHLKVNNNATAGLARLAMATTPALNGFFRTRAAPNTAHGRRLVDGKLYSETEGEQ